MKKLAAVLAFAALMAPAFAQDNPEAKVAEPTKKCACAPECKCKDGECKCKPGDCTCKGCKNTKKHKEKKN